MILTEQDNGRTVPVPAGSLVVVRLEENPTTGYRWAVAERGDLEPAGDESERGAGPGAAGTRALSFRAIRPGRSPLRLQNVRPWEAGGAAIARFEVTVEVR